ncbi:hypothetical protein ANCDUO_24734 [Ancylostoma duodenale]|uniref:Uncharacterized protein n=1 Tax=Ancylostoma duodenale TaxID=51022 RepID=A0A0C2FEX1_9BILA|nr:hypothetical protein ANCDUO_24734 [Ancylostoma duodenale]
MEHRLTSPRRYRGGVARTCLTSSMRMNGWRTPPILTSWTTPSGPFWRRRLVPNDTAGEALKPSLGKEWEEMPQETLRAAVESYPKRLKAVIKAKGGHIE